MRGRAGEIGAAIAAGRKNRLMRTEAMQRAVVHFQREHAAAVAVVVHEQIEHEILDKELRAMLERRAIERVQDRVTGTVGGSASALCGALAVMRGHAAERALIDFAGFRARKRDAPMLEFVHRLRRVAAEIFDRVLIAEPVRTFHGVVHVPAPVVFAHVAERSRDAALRRHRVRAGRENLADAGRLQARFGAADNRA
jgi:hypothetical protein